MSSKNSLNCWEIMKCENENCVARLDPEIPCWEHAAEVDDHRRAFNVCEDCLVYLIKEGGVEFSEPEMKDIMEQRGLCPLVE